MKTKILHILILTLFFTSCNIALNKAQNWLEQTNNGDIVYVEGNYFPIEDGLVKVFLPEGFEPITIKEYRKKLDSVLSKREVRNEIKRLETMRDMKGAFHLFFDSITGSTYTINTLPYTPFNRNDAKMLLALIKRNNNRISLTTDLNFKKITAAFQNTEDFTMFRSIFQIDDVENETVIFNSSYFITVKDQTFMINLITPFQVNFDGYIEKMKF